MKQIILLFFFVSLYVFAGDFPTAKKKIIKNGSSYSHSSTNMSSGKRFEGGCVNYKEYRSYYVFD